MYQRKSRRCCALMLAVSICLRLCLLLGLDARAAAWLSHVAAQPEFTRWMLFLETGAVAPLEQEPEKPRLWVLQVEQAPEDKPQPESPPHIPEEKPAPQVPEPMETRIITPVSAGQITVAGGCTYHYNKEALLARPSAMDFSGSGPQILIVHTHGTEAYAQEPGWEYDDLGGSRTLNPERSVIAVGDALARVLEEYGFSVIHDTTLNDYPSYNDSYWTALSKIESWQKQYPGLQMVIDVHRDAVEDEAGNAVALSAVTNGESCARLMLVVGTDQGGLWHPNWQENLGNALKLQSVLEGAYPGLCRNVDLRTERFNQHATPGSMLVEVGTNGNTLQQALRSAELLGEGLAQTLLTLQATGGTLQAP